MHRLPAAGLEMTRPMRRRLLNFLTALSLALCVAVGALWLWSYQHPVLFGVAGNSVEASRGWIYVNDLAGQMMLALRRRIPPEPLNLVWRRTPENSNTGQRFALPMASVPYWLLAHGILLSRYFLAHRGRPPPQRPLHRLWLRPSSQQGSMP